jgi:protein-S-isoprenylcysteine O-methyltransferase Ste14
VTERGQGRGRGPNVRFPPPLLFALAYLVAWLLDRYAMHLWPEIAPRNAVRVRLLGWILVVSGLSLAYWGVGTFMKMRTSIIPNRDARVLVVQGPYQFSRNPMYTGIVIASIGGIGVISSLWPLVTVAIAIVVLYLWVIRPEEHYLTTAFGDEYREYQRAVGRWFTF